MIATSLSDLKEGGRVGTAFIHIGIGDGVTCAINNDRWQHRDPIFASSLERERERECPFVKEKAEQSSQQSGENGQE